MANYLTNQQYTQAKARLTRAKKKGPQAVIDEVNRTFAQWDAGDYAWPDSWHTWNIARSDAEMELRYAR